MKNFLTRTVSTVFAVAALACSAASLPASAQHEQPHSLALPLPAPAPGAPPQQEATHARSAHHGQKIEQPILMATAAETGNSPLQGAGPPQGNPPATASQGSGLLLLSPLQGAGPMDARAMLLGSAAGPVK